MIRFISILSFQYDALKQFRTIVSRSKPFFKSVKGGLLALAILPLYIATPSLLAEPHQEQKSEQVTNTAPVDSTNNALADSSVDNKAGMHHPRGDLEGSYSLNTPARPGFWIAVGFTGFIIASLITSFVLFKPGKSK